MDNLNHVIKHAKHVLIIPIVILVKRIIIKSHLIKFVKLA